ncbi:MAG: radical SAM protein [Oscillospiraceae bacterium]|nr:radical SAM protein [Oscillospiraceae bacterium]
MAKFLFINPNKVHTLSSEVNGTLLLATKLLEAGIDADVLRFCQVESYLTDYDTFIRDIVSRIQEAKPTAVSFYTLWPYYHIMLRIAKVLKAQQPELTIIFGGPQSSATAQATMEAMPFIDYICTGEGENTIVPFAKAMLAGDEAGLNAVPGLWYRKDGAPVCTGGELPISDLNTLPRWDERLFVPVHDLNAPELKLRNYFMPIDAGRGCPYSCTFCCTSHFWRRTYRLKSPQRIVEDIRYFHDKFGITSFWFSHDAFTTNKQLVSDVCDYILESGLKITWRCTARIDCISEELILKMKQAGLIHIELGIETGSPRMQKIINKNLNLDKARRMIRFLMGTGLTVGLFYMYGLPEETEEDLAQTLDMLFDMLDLGVTHTSMSFCKFNPATAITEKYFNQLVLDPEIKIITRGLFGFDNELDTIRHNKAIFPHYYHLDTPVRRDYQYLHFFVYLYEQLREPMKQLRRLYQGDVLRFYRDFYQNNLPCFEGDILHTLECVKEQAVQMIDNAVSALDMPCIPQFNGLFRFCRDLMLLNDSPKDATIIRSYDMDYQDYAARKPIEEYRPCTSQILLCKKAGNTIVKVLSCR